MSSAAKTSRKSLSLTEARAAFSPLVEQIDSLGSVAVTVRGKVKAFLISPERMQAVDTRPQRSHPTRRSVRGTLEITGDLAAGSRRATLELRNAGLRSSRHAAR